MPRGRGETLADLVRAREIVRSQRAAPRRVGVMAVASAASFVLGAVRAAAVPRERSSMVAAARVVLVLTMLAPPDALGARCIRTPP